MLQSIRQVSTLLFGVAILLSGHGLQLAFVPLRAEVMGWSSSWVGALGSIYFCGFLAGYFAIPAVMARAGHSRTFAALTALMTSSILGLVLFSNFAYWLLLRFVCGVAISGLYLVIESWLNEQIENEVRGGVLATYTAIVLGALALGQLLLNMAPLEEDTLIVISAMLICIAAIPVCVTSTAQPSQIPAASFSPLLVIKTSRAAAIASGTAGVVLGSFYSLGPVYGLSIGMDVSGISVMMALGIAGGALSQLPLGRFSDKRDRRIVVLFIMLGGMLISLLACFISADNIPYIMLLFGACVMPVYALALAHASDNVANQSFLEVGTGLLVIHALGSIIGPLLTAQFMQLFGPQSFFSFNALVLLLGSVFIAFQIRSHRSKREHYSDFEPATTAAAQGVLQMDPRTQ